ncbi:hypothetical protein GQ53DRAFT_136267 [Thozetella sp. PMI_491]|nr:hypothetical protein GQ53DRAFT_136267 [Thozetella sp. PMI_491]
MPTLTRNRYQLFGGFNCAAPNYGNFQVTGGGPSCLPFASTLNVQGINVSYKNLKYQFIVFEKADCSDPGTILGTGGCYSHATGLKAIKLVPF